MNAAFHIAVATLFAVTGLGPLAMSSAYAVDAKIAAAVPAIDPASDLAAIAPASGGAVPASVAPQSHHDLVFGLGKPDEPFYKNGVFMIGDRLVTIEDGPVSGGELVSYDQAHDKILVSNDKTRSDTDKGAALLGLMDTLSVEQIEPAAGR